MSKSSNQKLRKEFSGYNEQKIFETLKLAHLFPPQESELGGTPLKKQDDVQEEEK